MPLLLSWCSRAGGGEGAVGWSGCLSVCVRRAGRPTPDSAGLPPLKAVIKASFSACQYHCPTYPDTYKHTCSGLAASTVEAPQPMLGWRSEPINTAGLRQQAPHPPPEVEVGARPLFANAETEKGEAVVCPSAFAHPGWFRGRGLLPARGGDNTRSWSEVTSCLSNMKPWERGA